MRSLTSASKIRDSVSSVLYCLAIQQDFQAVRWYCGVAPSGPQIQRRDGFVGDDVSRLRAAMCSLNNLVVLRADAARSEWDQVRTPSAILDAVRCGC